MDLMELRRGLLEQMAGSSFKCRQTSFVYDSSTQIISFSVKDKPYGILIGCEETEYVSGIVNNLINFSCIWSDYSGGDYVGGRVGAIKSGGADHWAISSSNIVYDATAKTITITLSPVGAVPNRTYYVWYYTNPF